MSESPYHLLLVDPHRAFRESFAFVLEREADLIVVGDAGTMAETRSWLETNTLPVHAVVTELQLPDGSGQDVVELVQKRFPASQTLALCNTADQRQHAQAIAAGMVGVLQKSVGIGTVIDAIRSMQSELPIHPINEMVTMLRLANQLLQEDQAIRAAFARLTPREMDVLRVLAQGLSDKEIAHQLKVSTNTVAAHIVHILSKLHVHSRLQAVLLGIKYGVIPLE